MDTVTRPRDTPVNRLVSYYLDIIDWHREMIHFVRTGEEHPGWLPPSPRRVTEDYWHEE